MATSENILKISKLEKEYQGKTVIHGIDLEIFPGEFVVVIGPSGAGKTTLVRCINQIIKPTSGHVEFLGVDFSQIKGKQLRKMSGKIGMIFQHYNVIGRTNVIRNVLHGCLGNHNFIKTALGLYSEDEKQKAVDLLKNVGLEEFVFKKVNTLSGGQMQRVGVCRAIMQKPKLILADEPISSLDQATATQIMDEVKKLVDAKEASCIMNLHQIQFAKKYATRIIGLKNGEIIFDGVPASLTDSIIQDIYEGKTEEIKLEHETLQMTELKLGVV